MINPLEELTGMTSTISRRNHRSSDELQKQTVYMMNFFSEKTLKRIYLSHIKEHARFDHSTEHRNDTIGIKATFFI
jgi:hypothetical protein